MGVHCYEIKFRTLILLVNVCKEIAQEETVDEEKLKNAIEKVRVAPVNMKQHYANRKASKK